MEKLSYKVKTSQLHFDGNIYEPISTKSFLKNNYLPQTDCYYNIGSNGQIKVIYYLTSWGERVTDYYFYIDKTEIVCEGNSTSAEARIFRNKLI